MRIKVVSFYTEGEPYDGGVNLTSGMYAFRQIAEDNGYLFDSYTPARLDTMGASCFSRKFPEEFKYEVNQHSHKIGFLAWKPFIIYDAMKNMDDDDIIFYLDANIGKYPSLREMVKNAKEVVSVVMENYDFYIGREFTDQSFPLIQFAHREVIDELGGGTEFVKNFPNLIANNVICRKTRFSEEILLDWISLCREDRFLYIQDNKQKQYSDFKWPCAEQSVLNAIIARHIQEGMLPWNYPGLSYGRGNTPRITDNSHVKYLKGENYIPKKHRLRNQFYQEREDTKFFLKDIYSGKLKKRSDLFDLNLTEENIFLKNKKAEENGKILYKNKECETLIIKDEKLKNKEVFLSIGIYLKIDAPVGVMIKTDKEDICLLFRDHNSTLTNKVVDYSVDKKTETYFIINSHFFINSEFLEIEIRDYFGYFYGVGKCFFEIDNISIKYRKEISLRK